MTDPSLAVVSRAPPSATWAERPAEDLPADRWVGDTILLTDSIVDALRIKLGVDAAHLRRRPLPRGTRSIPARQGGSATRVGIHPDYGFLEIDDAFGGAGDPYLWAILKEVMASGERVVIGFPASDGMIPLTIHRRVDGSDRPSTTRDILRASGQTLASWDLMRRAYGAVLPAGKPMSVTSPYDDLSLLFLMGTLATPRTVVHELLGHFGLAVRGHPFGHGDDLTGRGIVGRDGAAFRGTVLDYLRNHIEAAPAARPTPTMTPKAAKPSPSGTPRKRVGDVMEATPNCYKDIEAPGTVVPKIGFEFDCNYGGSTVDPPGNPREAGWGATVYSLEGKNITRHKIATDGFRLEGDGNRIEIATRPVLLTPAGRTELDDIMTDVLDLVRDLVARCRAVSPDTALGYPADIGAPRSFSAPYLKSAVKCVVALSLRRPPYYARGCSLGASPQATFTLPLAKIDRLVTVIQRSERFQVAGKALSGPPGTRQGVRSVALYQAQKAVNRSRDAHIRARTTLSGGTVVTATNFSPTLQGLLILMVSYLRTSELSYGSRDYETFAKAYLPLNVKNPFRLLFADLNADEKQVFTELYDSPRANLWRLARPGATDADGGNQLFPARTKGHLECWFGTAPTWDDFVEKTVKNTKLLRTDPCADGKKKGEDMGCEVLFAPLSRILPHEAGSRRVTVEMRRLGFNWVLSHGYTKNSTKHPGWSAMTTMLFKLAQELNA